jgi:hypothetical protein
LKDAGYTEARIVSEANQRPSFVKSGLLRRGALEGAGTGAVAFPLLDLLKEGGSSWREILRKFPKSAGLGGVIGAGAGWGIAKLVTKAHSDAVQASVNSFTSAVYDMEIAWTEALAMQAAREKAGTDKEDGPAR